MRRDVPIWYYYDAYHLKDYFTSNAEIYKYILKEGFLDFGFRYCYFSPKNKPVILVGSSSIVFHQSEMWCLKPSELKERYHLMEDKQTLVSVSIIQACNMSALICGGVGTLSVDQTWTSYMASNDSTPSHQ